MENRIAMLGKVDNMDCIITNGGLAIAKVGSSDIYFNRSSAGVNATKHLESIGATIEDNNVYLDNAYLGQFLNISEHFNQKNDLYRFFPEKEKVSGGTPTYPIYAVDNGYISKEGGAVRFINKFLLKDITMKDIVGKNITPDDMYYNEDTKTLHIIEKKHSMTIQGNAFERSASLPLFWSAIEPYLQERGITLDITFIFCKVATEWKVLQTLITQMEKLGMKSLIDKSKVDEPSQITWEDYKF